MKAVVRALGVDFKLPVALRWIAYCKTCGKRWVFIQITNLDILNAKGNRVLLREANAKDTKIKWFAAVSRDGY